jgi:ribosome-associated heat shock protein Hsp15
VKADQISNGIDEESRIDKWLWSARIYKTRALAAAACRKGQVQINGQPVKPSRLVKINDVITARVGTLNRVVRVLGLLHQRVGAEAARTFAQDETPAAEIERAREEYERSKPLFPRPKGKGRPTKKERRQLEELL